MTQPIPVKKPDPKLEPDKQPLLKKLAAKRVPKAVKAIQLVGNLASYAPTDAQINAILTALTRAVNEVENRLRKVVQPTTNTFTL